MSAGYIHSFTPQEQQRLIEQAEFLVPWIHRHVDYSGCARVLEVGCGVGAQLRVLSHRFSQVKFVGLDAAPEQLARARILLAGEIAAGRMELAQGSAYELPFPDASFDGAFFCWVFEHLEHPTAAMREAARVLKPGGVIFASEVFNAGVYCDPPRPAMAEYWRVFNKLQREFGGHPDIGMRLANLAVEAGLGEVELRDIAPHLDGRLTPAERKAMADYFCAIFSSGAAELVRRGRVTPELVAAMQRDFATLAVEPGSLMVYTAFQLRARRLKV
ncbi:MAG: methyltransferase domain-containing protein [Kiritimatiellaeota bacterium]|nr:methyltransferase domain-containing protein [Kiritimatiellota bacterium]